MQHSRYKTKLFLRKRPFLQRLVDYIYMYIYNCCFDVHVTRSISLGDWDISDLAWKNAGRYQYRELDQGTRSKQLSNVIFIHIISKTKDFIKIKINFKRKLLIFTYFFESTKFIHFQFFKIIFRHCKSCRLIFYGFKYTNFSSLFVAVCLIIISQFSVLN